VFPYPVIHPSTGVAFGRPPADNESMETNTTPPRHMPKVDRRGILLLPSSWNVLAAAIVADELFETPAARALAQMVMEAHGQRAVRDL
jgi:hypothetical protein